MTAEALLVLALGLLHLALAVVLVWRCPGRRATWALVILLVARGTWTVTEAMATFATDLPTAAYFERMSGYFLMVVPVAVLYLASVFPVQRPWMRWPGSWLPFAAVGAFLWVLHAQGPSAWHPWEGSDLAQGAWQIVGVGFALIAVLLLREYAKDPESPDGRSALLLSLGFALARSYDDPVLILREVRLGNPVLSSASALSVLASVLVFVALTALLLRHAMSERERVAAAARRYLVLLGLSVTTAVLAVALTPEATYAAGGGPTEDDAIGMVWNFALPLLVSYALLRHQLLGIDVKVRWTISKTTVAGVFIAIFFVASEAAQEFFGETLGSSYVGILAAGLLVFAIAPLSRFADRIAVKAVPLDQAAPPIAVRPGDEETYRVAVRKFLADGKILRSEERHLARLATRLGVDAERALAIRHEVEDGRKSGRVV